MLETEFAFHHGLFHVAAEVWPPDRHLGFFAALGKSPVALVNLLQDIGT